MKYEYKVGDRVEAIRCIAGSIPYGSLGTVCEVDPFSVGVRWDEYMGVCHSCNGACESGHGFYVYLSSDIRLVEESGNTDFSFNEIDFKIMIGVQHRKSNV